MKPSSNKITALEIKRQFIEGKSPQSIINKIVEDYSSTEEERYDLYDVIVQYSREMQKLSLQKQIEHLRGEINWL